MADSRMVITGATGFIGRHLLAAFHGEYEIWALSRGSPTLRGVSLPANVRWRPADVASRSDVGVVFDEIKRSGGADILVHLAGHYDFTGESASEYERTNVFGMRNVLDAAREVGVRDVVFASSVAACAFPAPGAALSEQSPPDGDTPYARSKRAGEQMLGEYGGSFRCWTVRFAALFSDWCEYEPLFRFLETWLSRPPRSRMLAGRGESAIPHLHVRDACSFVRALLSRRMTLDCSEKLLASPDGATSHRELFEAASAAHYGERLQPVLIPRVLCAPGVRLRDAIGRAVGLQSFERPWMCRMIDLRLAVDASRTRERLGWAPRPRLGILRRMPFLIQNRKSFPSEWLRHNHAALRSAPRLEHLRIHGLLRARAAEIETAVGAFVADPKRAHRFPHLSALESQALRSDLALLVEALVDAIRTGEKALFQTACRNFASRRHSEGVSLDELTTALDVMGDLSVLALSEEDPGLSRSVSLYDHITMTVQFGIDEVYEMLEEKSERP